MEEGWESWGWLGWRSPPRVRLIFSAKWWEGLQGGEKAAGSCDMIGGVFEEGGGDSGGWGGLGLRLGLGVRLVVL